MSFDSVQEIWDSQTVDDDAIDRDALLKQLKQRDRSFSRIVTITDVVMIMTLAFVGFMFMKDPILQGHDLALIVPGILSLFAAGMVWTGRADRKKQQSLFQDNLLGLIEKSIHGIQNRIWWLRNFLWWFAAPLSLGLLIGLFIIDDSKRHLLYVIFIPAFVLCMGLTYWQIRREIRIVLSPEQVRLEALRSRLTD